METDSLLFNSATLAANVLLFGFFYKTYKNRYQCGKALKEAESLEINNELQTKVQNSGGVIPYAIINGTVNAIKTPLKSEHITHVYGVIHKKVVKEHKAVWSLMLKKWIPTEHNISQTCNNVPFALFGSSGLFRRGISVEVLEPLSAHELVLSSIYNEFIPNQNNLSESVIDFLRGERITGIQEIEYMLIENTKLTAIGELIYENSKLLIKPPKNGLKYFLTTMSSESLINKIKEEEKFYKVLAFITGGISIILIGLLVKKLFVYFKRKLNIKRNRELFKRMSLQRAADISYEERETSVPQCVVCLTNPVQILILECGHACLCARCSEHVSSFCPVCRSPIDRFVPAFLP